MNVSGNKDGASTPEEGRRNEQTSLTGPKTRGPARPTKLQIKMEREVKKEANCTSMTTSTTI